METNSFQSFLNISAKVLARNLKNIIIDSKQLELADLIELKKILEKVLTDHNEYNDMIVSEQGAPYYM